MNKKLIIEETKKFVREKLEGEGTGHDWWHIERVYKTACFIGKKEKADMFVVELAALLHDIADWKFHDGNSYIGAEVSQKWLSKFEVDPIIIEKVCNIIKTLSFKGGTVDSTQHTIEGKVVQDADRLDAIGAIGIARAFAYGGNKNREIYNPNIDPKTFKDFNEYKKDDKNTTVNHFYEKLLKLKDLMNTDTGKQLAKQRHDFMENYLEQFYSEWNCEILI
ncbi:HD domain-containing protein [Clostridium sediminicola]|uniref:HD domain-containing protein n=1 Tax=Clostridium sediminicola TaxID=3114879 RepID=UPI0031F27339